MAIREVSNAKWCEWLDYYLAGPFSDITPIASQLANYAPDYVHTTIKVGIAKAIESTKPMIGSLFCIIFDARLIHI